jgi:hypothetical protein
MTVLLVVLGVAVAGMIVGGIICYRRLSQRSLDLEVESRR